MLPSSLFTSATTLTFLLAGGTRQDRHGDYNLNLPPKGEAITNPVLPEHKGTEVGVQVLPEHCPLGAVFAGPDGAKFMIDSRGVDGLEDTPMTQ